jgi:ribosome maturation factor RimP
VAPEQLDRYALAARIRQRLGPELAAEGYDLVDVRIFQGGGRQQVRLYVDLLGEERIDLDGCAAASRSASLLLEAADLFGGPWVLEVSSPGIRRPLRTEAHFRAAIGSDVELKWRPPQAATARPQNLRGRLLAIADGRLSIEPAARSAPAATETDAAADDGPPLVSVPIDAVLEANLEQDFDVQAVIREDRRRRKEDRKVSRTRRRRRASAASPADGAADRQDEETTAATRDERERRDGN